MSFELKRLLRGSLTYGVGTVVQRFIGILLLPFFTSELTPADYGVISLISLVSAGLTGIFNLGTSNSISILYFKEQKKDQRLTIIWSTVALLVIVSSVLVAILSFFSAEISLVIFQDKSYSELIIVAVITLALTTIGEPFLSFLRMEEKAKHFSIQSLSISFLTTLFSIFFILYLHWGALGFFLAALLGQLIMLLTSLVLVASKLPFKVQLSLFGPLIRIGFPSIFGLFAFLIIDFGDRQILQRFLGLSDLGIYSVGYNFGMVVMVAVNAFSSAWAPFFMSFINKIDEARQVFGKILRYYILGFGILCLFFFGFAKPFLSFIVAHNYLSAFNVVGLIAVGYVLRGSYLVFLPALYFNHKLKLQSFIEIIVAVVNISLNLWWVPLFGIMGSAMATVISYACLPFLTHLVTRKLLNVNYEWGKITWGLIIIVTSALILFISSNYLSNYYIISISVMTISIASFLVFKISLLRSERDFLISKLNLIRDFKFTS